mmetsp:Transcript_84443/g.244110  ORF Transcript_84443/g.244110 Transcript_84443/m.244110 type:complete len:164 (-) Transcript_84443:2130-2621(-)
MAKDGQGSGYIAVDTTLRMVECPVPDGSIFAIGDVASPPLGHEKQALQAESLGHIAAGNIIRTALHSDYSKQLHYPQDLIFNSTDFMPLVADLSLGRYDGIIVFNGITLPGPLAAVSKWLLEHTKVIDMEGRALGNMFWSFADGVVFWVSSTIVKPNAQIKKV